MSVPRIRCILWRLIVRALREDILAIGRYNLASCGNRHRLQSSFALLVFVTSPQETGNNNRDLLAQKFDNQKQVMEYAGISSQTNFTKTSLAALPSFWTLTRRELLNVCNYMLKLGIG